MDRLRASFTERFGQSSSCDLPLDVLHIFPVLVVEGFGAEGHPVQLDGKVEVADRPEEWELVEHVEDVGLLVVGAEKEEILDEVQQ